MNSTKYSNLYNLFDQLLQIIKDKYEELKDIHSKDHSIFSNQEVISKLQDFIDYYDKINNKNKNKNIKLIILYNYNKDIKHHIKHLILLCEGIINSINNYNSKLGHNIQNISDLINQIIKLYNNQSNNVDKQAILKTQAILTQAQLAVQIANNDEQKARSIVTNAITVVNTTRNALGIANQDVSTATNHHTRITGFQTIVTPHFAIITLMRTETLRQNTIYNNSITIVINTIDGIVNSINNIGTTGYATPQQVIDAYGAFALDANGNPILDLNGFRTHGIMSPPFQNMVSRLDRLKNAINYIRSVIIPVPLEIPRDLMTEVAPLVTGIVGIFNNVTPTFLVDLASYKILTNNILLYINTLITNVPNISNLVTPGIAVPIQQDLINIQIIITECHTIISNMNAVAREEDTAKLLFSRILAYIIKAFSLASSYVIEVIYTIANAINTDMGQKVITVQTALANAQTKLNNAQTAYDTEFRNALNSQTILDNAIQAKIAKKYTESQAKQTLQKQQNNRQILMEEIKKNMFDITNPNIDTEKELSKFTLKESKDSYQFLKNKYDEIKST